MSAHKGTLQCRWRGGGECHCMKWFYHKISVFVTWVTCSGVMFCRFSRLTSAPYFSSTITAAWKFQRTASCSGVLPRTLAVLGSAPCCDERKVWSGLTETGKNDFQIFGDFGNRWWQPLSSKEKAETQSRVHWNLAFTSRSPQYIERLPESVPHDSITHKWIPPIRPPWNSDHSCQSHRQTVLIITVDRGSSSEGPAIWETSLDIPASLHVPNLDLLRMTALGCILGVGSQKEAVQ